MLSFEGSQTMGAVAIVEKLNVRKFDSLIGTIPPNYPQCLLAVTALSESVAQSDYTGSTANEWYSG